jgi:hypothetical protein
VGFALGASFFFGMYGRNVTESSIAAQHEQKASGETTKSKKDEADEAIAFYTLWLMAFTGILAFATIGLGGATVLLYATGEKQFKFAIRSGIRQSREMKASIDLARDDFNATHRPWVPITSAAVHSGFNWVNGTAIVGFSVCCKNTGNSPAQRVSLASRIFPFLVNEEIPQEIAKLQASHPLPGALPQLIEHTLFPDIDGELRLSTALAIPAGEFASLKDRFGGPATEMVPVILGSIEYYFSFGEQTPHYTPFVYHLWRTDAEGAARITFKLDGSNVQVSEMLLQPLISAGDPT